MYPGTKPGCFGQTRVCTRVLNLIVLVILGYKTRVLNLVVLVKLGYVPGHVFRVCLVLLERYNIYSWVSGYENLVVLVILVYVPGYRSSRLFTHLQKTSLML